MKWKFICLSLFIILGQIFSIAFAEDFSKCTLSIEDLKRRLDKLQLDRENEEKGIFNSDRIRMQALELVLIARANGDKKALEVAEKAVKEAEEAKNRHKKNKELIQQEINLVQQYIKIAEENNLKSLGNVCAKYREQVDRDKEVLKRFIKEAERLSKAQAEREKEIEKEIVDFALDVLPTSLSLVKDTKIIFGQLGKRIQDKINSHQIKDYNTKKKLWKIGDKVRHLLDFIDGFYFKISEGATLASQGAKTGIWSSDTYSKIIAYVKLAHENNEQINKYLDELRADLKDLATSQETKELVADLSVGLIEDLSKQYAIKVLKALPYINIINNLSTISYHYMSINYLDEEVNRDYRFTEDLFNQYNLLKAQFDKDWQKLKMCEEYCKKNAKKE